MKKFVITFIVSIVVICGYGNEINNDSIMKLYCAQDAITDSTLSNKIDYAFSKLIKDYFTFEPLDENQLYFLMDNEKKMSKKDRGLYYYVFYLYYISEDDNSNQIIATYLLKEAAKLDPKNKHYINLLVQTSLNEKNYSQTKKYCKLLSRVENDKIEVYSPLFYNAYTNNKFNEAKKYATKIFRLDNDAEKYIQSMTGCLTSESGWEKAAKFLNSEIEKNTDYKNIAVISLSEVYFYTQQYESSIETLNKNKDVLDSTTLYLYLSQNYKQMGNDSLFAYYTLKTIEGDNLNFKTIEPNIRTTIAYYNQINRQEKIDTILNLLSTNFPSSLEMLNLKVDIYKMKNDSINIYNTLQYITDNYYDEQKSIEFLQLLIDKESDKETICNYCHKNYYKYNKNQWLVQYLATSLNDSTLSIQSINDTINNYLTGIEDNKTKAILYEIYSSCLMIRQCNDIDILNAIDSCLKYNPDNMLSLNNKAYYLSKDSTQLIEAEKIAQKALQIGPNNSFILDTYAWILYLQKNYFLANIYFDKALRTFDEEKRDSIHKIALLFHKGKNDFALNKKNDAEEIWKQILQIYETLNDNQKQELNTEEQNIILEVQQYYKEQNDEE